MKKNMFVFLLVNIFCLHLAYAADYSAQADKDADIVLSEVFSDRIDNEATFNKVSYKTVINASEGALPVNPDLRTNHFVDKTVSENTGSAFALLKQEITIITPVNIESSAKTESQTGFQRNNLNLKAQSKNISVFDAETSGQDISLLPAQTSNANGWINVFNDEFADVRSIGAETTNTIELDGKNSIGNFSGKSTNIITGDAISEINSGSIGIKTAAESVRTYAKQTTVSAGNTTRLEAATSAIRNGAGAEYSANINQTNNFTK